MKLKSESCYIIGDGVKNYFENFVFAPLPQPFFGKKNRKKKLSSFDCYHRAMLRNNQNYQP